MFFNQAIYNGFVYQQVLTVLHRNVKHIKHKHIMK